MLTREEVIEQLYIFGDLCRVLSEPRDTGANTKTIMLAFRQAEEVVNQLADSIMKGQEKDV